MKKHYFLGLFISIICLIGLVGCKQDNENNNFKMVQDALANTEVTYKSYTKKITIEQASLLIAEEIEENVLTDDGNVTKTITTKKINNLDYDEPYTQTTQTTTLPVASADLFSGYELNEADFEKYTCEENDSKIEFKGTVLKTSYDIFVSYNGSSIKNLVVDITLDKATNKILKVTFGYQNASSNKTQIEYVFTY